MTHIFDVSIAEQVGLQEAIILEYLHFWIKKNTANGVNYHDGSYWTYNSVKAFSELFPYMSASTINRVLSKLEELDLIKTGHYNRVAYDRTKWYSLTEAALALFGEKPACPPAVAQEETEEEWHAGKKESETEKEFKRKLNTYPEGFENFWAVYPRKTDKGAAYKCYCARVKDGFTAEELRTAAEAYAGQCKRERTEQRFIKQAKTFLGPATPFLDYLRENHAIETETEEEEKSIKEYVQFLRGVGH